MTHREIARQLHISPASLSLILNHKAGISSATRERVLRELKEMGYEHLIKPAAQQVPVTKDLYFIIYQRNGFILGYSPFVYLLTESMEKQAQKYGFNVLLKPLDSGCNLDAEIDAINNQMGTFQAIEYLVNMGHTDIGYVHTTEYISSWSERALGYRQALAQFRLPLSDDKVYRARYNGGNSYDDFCQVIASGAQLPTALVTDDDVIAVGVMRALQDAGYRVPEDISIVGFNNRPVCELVHPMLTSIDVPKQDFSTEAVDALVSLIQKQQRGELPKLAVKRRITTTLVERQSVCRIL